MRVCSDVIEEFLRQYGALSENVTICSNRLNYSADSAPKSVSPDPPITSFTKQYAYESASAFFKQHAKRRGILQMGDSLSDVDPARNVRRCHALACTHPRARAREGESRRANTRTASTRWHRCRTTIYSRLGF